MKLEKELLDKLNEMNDSGYIIGDPPANYLDEIIKDRKSNIPNRKKFKFIKKLGK